MNREPITMGGQIEIEPDGNGGLTMTSHGAQQGRPVTLKHPASKTATLLKVEVDLDTGQVSLTVDVEDAKDAWSTGSKTSPSASGEALQKYS